MHHVIRRAGAMLCASVLVLAACGDDDTSTDTTSPDETTTTTTTSPPTSTTGATDDPSDEPDAEPTDDGTVLEVSVAGGAVTGGGRQAVPLGDTVTIRVTSDVADHVHLHGYDVLADVGAGETAELTFEASIPGVFEVELEDAGLHLLELEIS